MRPQRRAGHSVIEISHAISTMGNSGVATLKMKKETWKWNLLPS
jgi:hypothetical protein